MNTMKRNTPMGCVFSVIIAASMMTFLPGCGGGDAGPQTYTVTGTVSYDGTPIPEGRITFTMVSTGEGFSSEINDGSYELQAEAGEMKVAITASRIVPGKFGEAASPDEEPPPLSEMYIPEIYNSQTTLTATVTPDGDNVFPFDLEGE